MRSKSHVSWRVVGLTLLLVELKHQCYLIRLCREHLSRAPDQVIFLWFA